MGGDCVLMCPGNQTNCSGMCKNLNNDEANCGSCGHACGNNQACMGGDCVLMCPGTRRTAMGCARTSITTRRTAAPADIRAKPVSGAMGGGLSDAETCARARTATTTTHAPATAVTLPMAKCIKQPNLPNGSSCKPPEDGQCQDGMCRKVMADCRALRPTANVVHERQLQQRRVPAQAQQRCSLRHGRRMSRRHVPRARNDWKSAAPERSRYSVFAFSTVFSRIGGSFHPAPQVSKLPIQ
jgi:hypothetical protein